MEFWLFLDVFVNWPLKYFPLVYLFRRKLRKPPPTSRQRKRPNPTPREAKKVKIYCDAIFLASNLLSPSLFRQSRWQKVMGAQNIAGCRSANDEFRFRNFPEINVPQHFVTIRRCIIWSTNFQIKTFKLSRKTKSHEISFVVFKIYIF